MYSLLNSLMFYLLIFSVVLREVLYEDETFSDRELAALVVSKVRMCHFVLLQSITILCTQYDVRLACMYCFSTASENDCLRKFFVH